MIDPTQAQPGAAPAAAAPAAPATICIAAQPDGSFMVYPEQDGPDGAAPVQDIDAALDQARQILTGATPDAPAGEEANQDADSLFEQGFNTVRGVPLNRQG